MVELGKWRWIGITLVIMGLCPGPWNLPAQSQTQPAQTQPAQKQSANSASSQSGDQSQPAAGQDQQNIPDAPSASRPPQPPRSLNHAQTAGRRCHR